MGTETTKGTTGAAGPSVRARLLRALARVAELLVAHAGQREVLRRILALLEETGIYQRATLMLLAASGEELVAADTGAGSPVEVSYRSGEGITGRVLASGTPAVIPSIHNEPDFRDRLHRRQASGLEDSGFVCVPIKLGAEIVGTLNADVPLCAPEELEVRAEALAVAATMVAYDVAGRRREEMEHAHLEEEKLRMRAALGEHFRPENMVGSSNLMRTVYRQIHQVAGSAVTVLIRGESGTGKELVASAIHYASARAEAPFVRVNCAALNENLLESELFGHEKGSFTGATQSRQGRIEEAEGGTLFLDEIGEFSPATQVKLLRVLQEREYERVGSNTTRRADVRIIAATNRDLEEAVSDGGFRLDLYYRVNVFPIVLPPLRERRDDVLALANHFLMKNAAVMDKPIIRISTTAINMLMAYHWPGNIRELENCIEYAVLVARGEVIDGRDLPPTLQMPSDAAETEHSSLKDMVNALERDMIMDALKRNDGVVVRAASDLGITARMVHYKIRNLEIPYHTVFKHRRRKQGKAVVAGEGQ
ncbi:MAG: sigma 54-interacting transcriptional regulator [Planctomycetota bacterium]